MTDVQDRRPHRGRGDQRPCDMCRKRKARCVILDLSGCERCKKTRRACTFNDPPTAHVPKRKTPPSTTTTYSAVENGTANTAWDDSFLLDLDTLPSMVNLDLPLDAQLFESSVDCSLEDPLQEHTFMLGPSSDPDPFFRARYAYDANGHHQATARGYYRVSQERDPLVFAMTPGHRTRAMANDISMPANEPLVAELEPYAPRLFRLFHHFVHPAFPLPVDKVPETKLTTLGAAVCAVALTWRSHDNSLPWAPFEHAGSPTELPCPDVRRLYNYVWNGISRGMHAPSYDTIQAALLLIERRIPLTDLTDSPFNSCLQASISSMALSLGLHRDPESWINISADAKQKRRMLWWLVFIEDTFVSAAAGKQPTIRDGDYDVSQPSFNYAGSPSDVHFEYLLSLTFILRDILGDLLNWKFWSQQTVNIQEVIDKTQVLKDRLHTWRESLRQSPIVTAPEDTEETTHGVLIVARLYCLVLIHKTLLRVTNGSHYFEGTFQESLQFSSTLHSELSSLRVNDFTSFWFSWSHSQFNAFSEFMPYLISIAPTEEYRSSAKQASTRLRQWLFLHAKYIDLVRVAMCRLDACEAAIDSGKVLVTSNGMDGSFSFANVQS